MRTRVFLALLLPLLAFAQLVPLELDQTIPLTDNSAIWDVMPHPDGSYLWVQAVANGSSTRLYWGATNSAGRDSLTFADGVPQAVVCFWSTEDQPAVVLSRIAGPSENSSLWAQAIRLSDGEPLSPEMTWWHFPGRNTYYYYTDYRMGLAAPLPPPPQISVSIPAFITWHLRVESEYYGTHSTFNTNETEVYRDLLTGDATHAGNIAPANLFTASWDQSVMHLGCAGTQTSSWNGPGGGGNTITYYTGMVEFIGDTIRMPRSEDCFSDAIYPLCLHEPLVSTMVQGHPVLAGRLVPEDFGAVDSSSQLWRRTASYSLALACDVVSGNSSEEFLCYDNSRQVFDVLGAADGHNYGVTSPILPSNEPRIVGRYDSTSRRLVFREGNVLWFYRFGEYLGTEVGQRPTQVESYELAAYPNPFNPVTQIVFVLPRGGRADLGVFDLTGRNVLTLADDVFAAGEHHVSFDGSSLPSGVYFVRLAAGNAQRVQKLMLLK